MSDQHSRKKAKLPTGHELAPKVSAEITPVLKGGHMERKIQDERG